MTPDEFFTELAELLHKADVTFMQGTLVCFMNYPNEYEVTIQVPLQSGRIELAVSEVKRKVPEIY